MKCPYCDVPLFEEALMICCINNECAGGLMVRSLDASNRETMSDFVIKTEEQRVVRNLIKLLSLP